MKQETLKYKWCLILAATSILLGTQAHPVHAATTPVRFPDNIEWISTGIRVETGQTIRISSLGLVIAAPSDISFGAGSGPGGQVWDLGCGPYEGTPPPCALLGARYGALMGKVGPDGTPFRISATDSFLAPTSGNLYLALNDSIGFSNDQQNGFMVTFLE